MDCSEFLGGYSGFRDGLMSGPETAIFASHLARCEPCARYDRIVQEGLDLVRELPAAETSRDFMPRLQHRLYHVEDGIPFSGGRLGGSAALVGVAAVGLLAFFWLPFAANVPVEVELPAVAVEAPPGARPSVPLLFRNGPFITASRTERSRLAASGTHLELPVDMDSSAGWPPDPDSPASRFIVLKTGGSGPAHPAP